MRPVFIGDEVTGTGYRLAGVDVRSPPLAEAGSALREAISQRPPLILVTMEFAQQLGDTDLLDLLSAVAPPVLPVADAAGRVPVADFAARIRQGIIA